MRIHLACVAYRLCKLLAPSTSALSIFYSVSYSLNLLSTSTFIRHVCQRSSRTSVLQRSDQFVAVEISRCEHLHIEETFFKSTFSVAFENVEVESAGVDIRCGALRKEHKLRYIWFVLVCKLRNVFFRWCPCKSQLIEE